MKEKDRYLKLVEWSEEDGCYVGTCPGLMLGGVHGDDESQVYKELCEAVEEWIEIYKEDGEDLPEVTAGREYSGKFVLRAGKENHKKLAISAMREGQSLNSFCLKKLFEEKREVTKTTEFIAGLDRDKGELNNINKLLRRLAIKSD